jgi:hypothetical protein
LVWAFLAPQTVILKPRLTAKGSGLKNWNITGQYIPESLRQAGEGEVVKVDLNRPMKEILAQLSQYPVSARLC